MSVTPEQRAALTALIKHVKHGTPEPDQSALPPWEADTPELSAELAAEMREHQMMCDLLKGVVVCSAPGCGFVDRNAKIDWENM